jgi:hypothetical protein
MIKGRPPFIYALFDPREPEHVRYIGMTVTVPSHPCYLRPLQHRECKIRPSKSYKSNWIRKLAKEGIDYEFRIIEQLPGNTPDEVVCEREKHHIATYRAAGHRLTNSTDGGDIGRKVDPMLVEYQRELMLIKSRERKLNLMSKLSFWTLFRLVVAKKLKDDEDLTVRRREILLTRNLEAKQARREMSETDRNLARDKQRRAAKAGWVKAKSRMSREEISEMKRQAALGSRRARKNRSHFRDPIYWRLLQACCEVELIRRKERMAAHNRSPQMRAKVRAAKLAHYAKIEPPHAEAAARRAQRAKLREQENLH